MPPEPTPPEKIDTFRKVKAQHAGAMTDGERTAAQGRLDAMKARYPGIEAAAERLNGSTANGSTGLPPFAEELLRGAFQGAGLSWPPDFEAMKRKAAEEFGRQARQHVEETLRGSGQEEESVEEDPARTYADEIARIAVSEKNGRLRVGLSIDAHALKALERADPAWREQVLLALGDLVADELLELYDDVG